MKTLWDKGYGTEQAVEKFTVGKDRELDLRMAAHDVAGSVAHARMLESIGLLTAGELESLLGALQEISQTIAQGGFVIEEGVEDIHSQVELLLTRRLGETGKKIHAGRSRNDQVLVDLKLFLRDAVREVAGATMELFTQLQALSERHKRVLMPGYTHMQVAMPSSFGLWFGAYAETLADDILLLQAAYRHADQNPLGSAAGYGSSFPLDRGMTTRLLGFSSMHYNVVAAQMSRGKCERAMACAIAAIAATLGRLATDVCMYSGQNFAFLSFPKELTTGSSIMPHKKNLDVFELVRARCNRLQTLPGELAIVSANLPTGYHRDFQLFKEMLFPAVDDIMECLKISAFMLEHISVNEHILDDPKYDYLFTVEEVNRLVLEGLPFREAYARVGRQVESGEYEACREVHHTHQGSIGNLCTDEIRKKMEERITEILPVGLPL